MGLKKGGEQTRKCDGKMHGKYRCQISFGLDLPAAFIIVIYLSSYLNFICLSECASYIYPEFIIEANWKHHSEVHYFVQSYPIF